MELDECVVQDGARGRNRTGTVFPPRDFKSLASTNFATRAGGLSCSVDEA